VTLTRTFLKLLDTDLGYKPDHVITMNASLVGLREENNEQRAATAALLAATAFGAIWRASARILRIDPMSALRAE